MASGPEQVESLCDTAIAVLDDAFELPETTGTRQQWAAAAAAAQRVANTAAAIQDACIARLAAIEPEALEDGTWVESYRALGHVALDSPAILSGALSVSASHAERRVTAAVALAADGPTGTITDTGLGGLHHAMRTGRLDSYRSAVVADELQFAPPQVRETVITALEPWFDVEDGAHLRRRARRHLARISPDLLRQRAQRARTSSGLRRWADEPGVDKWEGTFPSEEAAQAWAAIDALAQQYVADGTCSTIERARAKALTDLVAGNSTVKYVITLTTPAATGGTRCGGTESTPTTPATTTSGEDAGAGEPTRTMPVRGEPPTREACAAPETKPEPSPNPGDLVEVGGLRPGDKALVARSWLDAVLAAPTSTTTLVSCHPTTGALLHEPRPTGGGTNDDRSGTKLPSGDGYRPGTRLTALVRTRDGRCRFPGCAIAARFCDLDHVRPWPTGPTADDNLICLCRRHHRVKQRRGWQVTLHPDGRVTWTEPTGRVRTTEPQDALHTLVLPQHPADTETDDGVHRSRPRTEVPDGPHSALEFRLEHLTARPAGTGPTTGTTLTAWRDQNGRHGIQLIRPVPGRAALTIDIDAPWAHQRPRRRSRCRHDEPPPF